MILLVNRCYPALGPIVGAFVGLMMMVAGVLLGSTMMVVWGAPSVALGCLRAVHQVRQPDPRQGS
jgi:hypothetical protein